MKRKQTVVFPPKLTEDIFHAFIASEDSAWRRYKLCHLEIDDSMETFMQDNKDACVASYGWPVTHAQFHVYLTRYMKKKIERKEFMKAQQIDETVMRWLETPTTLATLIGAYGTEPPKKKPKRDCRDTGLYLNGYANTVDGINQNLKVAIDDILGPNVSLTHMVALGPEITEMFLSEKVGVSESLNETIDEIRECFDEVVASTKQYRASVRKLVEELEYKEYPDDEDSESYGNHCDDNYEDDEDDEEGDE